MFRSVPYKTSFCYFDNKNGYLVIFINLQVKLKYKTFTRRIFHWNSLSAVSCDVNGWSKGTVGMTGDNCFPIHWVSRLKKKFKNESVLILEYKNFLKYHCMTDCLLSTFYFDCVTQNSPIMQCQPRFGITNTTLPPPSLTSHTRSLSPLGLRLKISSRV